MKGVLLNAVEEAVSAEWGEQMWDELLTACGLDGAYTALGNYPDAELVALARAAAERLDCSVDDVQRTLGRLTFKPLMTRYRRFPEAPTSLRELPPSPSLPSSPLPLPPLGAPSSAPDPRPPPPADALINTGKPIFSAHRWASSADSTSPSDPGTTGMPASCAACFAAILSPINRI